MSFREWWEDDTHFMRRTVKNWTRGRVPLYTMTYDEATECYTERVVMMTPSDIRKVYPDALHISGRSGYYHMDIGTGQWPEAGECTAIDLYLYLVNNSIKDALFYKLKPKFFIDWKMIGLAGVAVVVVAMLYMMGVFKI